ncbi:hypothetical protein Tco_0268013 [Tanacetum coccineum]
MVVCKIGKPRGIIITTESNHPKCLRRGKIFHDSSLFTDKRNTNFWNEQQNPPEIVIGLSILLSKQSVMCLSLGSLFCLQSVLVEVIGLYVALGCPPTAKSLASHMISKGKSQSGATRN